MSLMENLVSPKKNGPRMRAVTVGVAGFEPTTSCSQSRRDTGLRYTPKSTKIRVNPQKDNARRMPQ